MTHAPAISVLMLVRDGQAHLEACLESLLAQSFGGFELLIGDDGSRDGTAEILEAFRQRDARLVVIHRRPGGAADPALRNQLLRAARGRCVAWMDAAGIADPDRLRVQLRHLERNPGVFLVAGAARLLDGLGREAGVWRFPGDAARIAAVLPEQNILLSATVMVRNEPGLLFRDRFDGAAQDYDFCLNLLSRGKRLEALPDLVLRQRLPPERSSAGWRARQVLLERQARLFYRQRRRQGGVDGYAGFDPSLVGQPDPETTRDGEVLRVLAVAALRRGRFARARGLLLRALTSQSGPQRQPPGRLWRLWRLSWLGSWFGSRGRSRLIAGLDRLEAEAVAALGVVESARLAWVFPVGAGLAGLAARGALERTLPLLRRLEGDGWRLALFSFDRARHLPDTGLRAAVHTRRLFLPVAPFDGLYALYLPLLRWFSGRRVQVILTGQGWRSWGWHAVLCGWFWGAPVVVRCTAPRGWVAAVGGGGGGLARRLVDRLAIGFERWTLTRAAHCLVSGSGPAAWLARHYRIDPERLTVSPDPVDVERFRPGYESAPDIDLLCVGALEPHKRLPLVLSALQKLRAELVLVGDGPEWQALRERIELEDLPVELVRQAPPERMPHYYRRARVYLIASAWEGQPRALLEAMACGCACVGTRSPGIEPLIRDGQTGLLVDATPEGIARGVSSLLADAALRRRLGLQARNFVLENYTADGACDRFKAVLTEACARPKRV